MTKERFPLPSCINRLVTILTLGQNENNKYNFNVTKESNLISINWGSLRGEWVVELVKQKRNKRKEKKVLEVILNQITNKYCFYYVTIICLICNIFKLIPIGLFKTTTPTTNKQYFVLNKYLIQLLVRVRVCECVRVYFTCVCKILRK